eukprot:4922698-Alexandrium_andersonii.AAC.1
MLVLDVLVPHVVDVRDSPSMNTSSESIRGYLDGSCTLHRPCDCTPRSGSALSCPVATCAPRIRTRTSLTG